MAAVLVTGAGGFIGRALCTHLLAQGVAVRGVVRSAVSDPVHGVEYHCIDIEQDYDVKELCSGVDVVVHLAGKAHGQGGAGRQTLGDFLSSNVGPTLTLAEGAVVAGVRRFLFMSSIGVNGAATFGRAFDESSEPAPHAPYAESKYAAEKALVDLLHGSTMELVRIRPPLVYGFQAPGNFRRLLKLVGSGLPLPFLWVNNARSLVSVENLVSLVSVCVDHPKAANELFLASDGEDLSTSEIVVALSKGMGKKVRLFPVPQDLIRLFAKLVGKESLYTQLFLDLQVSSSKARRLLDWRPVGNSQSQLKDVGRKYLEHN